jgi:predicted Mrr-cat superfamily restriction endonuclease
MPGRSEGSLASVVGQTWNFVHEIRIGDLVASPWDRGSRLSVGRVAGDCVGAPVDIDLRYVRTVEWLTHDIHAGRLAVVPGVYETRCDGSF